MGVKLPDFMPDMPMLHNFRTRDINAYNHVPKHMYVYSMCTLNLHAYSRLSYSHVCLKLCNLMTRNLISTKIFAPTFKVAHVYTHVWLMYREIYNALYTTVYC